MIDWREFIAALRPDWTDRGPLTDMERIDDEINKTSTNIHEKVTPNH